MREGLYIRGKVVGFYGNRVLISTGRGKLYSVWVRSVDGLSVGDEVDWIVFVFWDKKGRLVELGKSEEKEES